MLLATQAGLCFSQCIRVSEKEVLPQPGPRGKESAFGIGQPWFQIHPPFLIGTPISTSILVSQEVMRGWVGVSISLWLMSVKYLMAGIDQLTLPLCPSTSPHEEVT